MLSDVRDPYRIVTSVASSAVPRMAWSAWSMGAMPVPPTSMPTFFAPKGNCFFTLKGMCLKSAAAPTASVAMNRLRLPAS